jgi:hypothetical protein
MFGDSLRPTASLVFRDQTGQLGSNLNLMLAGGGSYNVAENNKALPMDRVYFQYNGFANALPSNQGGQTSLHMYSLGFEKTFFDGLWSIDLRMPFNSGLAFNSNTLSSDSGNVGNLSMFLKGLLYKDESLAISSGLGIGLPTGSDSVTSTQFDQLTVQNQAIHLMPFLAFTAAPNEDWFFQAFTQIDFAASGNDVVSSRHDDWPLVCSESGISPFEWYRRRTRVALRELASRLRQRACFGRLSFWRDQCSRQSIRSLESYVWPSFSVNTLVQSSSWCGGSIASFSGPRL